MTDGLTMTLLATFAGVFGLLIGSFLNVVVSRVPAGLSVVSPRSRCPQCETPIAARDNIPIASWLALRGRCRQCSTRISAVYPAVEGLTGAAFVAVALLSFPALVQASGVGETVAAVAQALGLFWLAGASIALTIIDLQTHRLPNAIVYPTIGVALVTAAVTALGAGDPTVLMRAVLGAVILFTIYLGLGLAWKGGMGFGDVKLSAALGAYLGAVGWGALVVGWFAAFVLGGLLSVALILLRVVDRKSGIPFGPWMLAGAWIGIVAGEDIARAYMSLVGFG